MRTLFSRSRNLALVLAGGAVFVGAAFVLSHSFVRAQEAPAIPTGGPPADVAHGPTAAQLAAFEQEQGAPVDAFNQQAVEPPSIPEPETIPDDIKKLVPEKELLDLYCAMTKWKSGDFFLAMDALQKYQVPAIEQARALGVDLAAPDTAGLKAEGTKRLNAICAAKTIGEAEQLAKDFAQWGRDSSSASMQSQRADMETKMKALGDGIKSKVKEQLQPFIDAETAKIEPEIKAKAEEIAQSVVAPYQGQQAPGSTPPDPAAIQAMVEAAIASQLQPIIDAKTAEIETKIKAKANEIVAPEKKKIETIANLFQGLDKKINDAITAGAGKYAAEKKTALGLRRDLMAKVLETNITAAQKHLDDSAADIEKARKNNPALKSAADLKAELDQDKKDTLAKIDLALANGDEQAMMQALADLTTKWQKVQQQAQDAALQSVTQMCDLAGPEFAAAKQQLQPGLQQIQDLQTRCAASTDADCEQVTAISDRLSTVSTKMGDLITEMDLVTGMCQSSNADPNELLALLQKIQRDGQDAQVFSQALEAAKSKILVNSVKSACDEALPQLQAGRVELTNNDLVVLKNNLDKCRGKTTPECAPVNEIQSKYDAFKAQADAFIASIDQVNGLCRKSKTDADFDKIFSTLSDLQQQGDDLQAQASDLKSEQAKNSPDEAKCRIAVEKMTSVRLQVADGQKLLNDTRASLCGGNPKAVCEDIRKLTVAMGAVSNGAENVLGQVTGVENDCKKPYKSTHAADITTHLANVETGGVALQKAVDDLKNQADQLKQGTGGLWIEAENESKYNIYPRDQRPAINMKEVNPAWRPPYYGTGDWYLAVGGEWLSYQISAPKAGTYSVWIRDYVDKYQARGIRRVTVGFDDKTYGTFPETTVPSPGDKGAFGWHKVGSGVTLTAGNHTLKITKEASTAGAALLDAYYLTTGNEVPPEK